MSNLNRTLTSNLRGCWHTTGWIILYTISTQFAIITFARLYRKYHVERRRRKNRKKWTRINLNKHLCGKPERRTRARIPARINKLSDTVWAAGITISLHATDTRYVDTYVNHTRAGFARKTLHIRNTTTKPCHYHLG